MNSKGLLLLLITILTIPTPAYTAESPCVKVKNRPCVALVLGGGGARGGAHVGVIRQLEALKIPVDIVIGTSFGAFVGGLYASGHSPDDIERIFSELNWGAGFRDHVFRDEMPMRRKQQRDAFPMRLDLGLDTSGLKVPKGLLLGQAMNELVQQAYGLQADFVHFDQLAIPFRAVAANLSNRDTVVLAKGSLVASVQASMSIPGVVRPVVLNGLTLVDGGVANNLPISVAQQLGADHVIAVGIDAPLRPAEALDSAFAITEQLTSFLVKQVVSQQKALLRPTDILIEPNVKDIGTLDFAKVKHAIIAGEVAAKQSTDSLALLSTSPSQYKNWLVSHRRERIDKNQIDQVLLVNQTRLADSVIQQRLNIGTGETYNTEQLTDGLRRVYGLDTMERVSQELYLLPDGSRELKVTAEEKSWGPSYINFRFLLDDDFHTNRHMQLAGSYTLTNLSELGAEWHNELAVGTDKIFNSEIYWPVFTPSTYLTSSFKWHSETLILEDQQGLSMGEFFRRESIFSAGVGWNLSDHSAVEAGWLSRQGSYRLPTLLSVAFGDNKLPFDRNGLALSMRWDSLNDLSFPTRGFMFNGKREWLNDSFQSVNSSSVNTSIELVAAKGVNNHLLKTRWRYDKYKSAAEEVGLEQFSLGGLFNLSGYPKNFLYGSEVKFSSVIYMYKMHENRLSFFDSPLYVGTSIERGWVGENVWLPDNISKASWVWAGSIFAGWDSPIGPIFIGYGKAEDNYKDRADQFYLSIGQSY
ncbi:MAG: patatin-like phospholipase family protein [Thalassotalea sp.]